MNRVETMPTWMLRLILKLPLMRKYWSAAWLELWKREILDVVAAEADEESGPWPVAMPRGMH